MRFNFNVNTRIQDRRGRSVSGKTKPRAVQRLRNGGWVRGGWGGKQRQRGNMRHSCRLGLTYRAARDVTDGHVRHCTNKQTLNHEHMCKHTVQHTDACISFLGRIIHRRQLSPNPAFTGLHFICGPQLVDYYKSNSCKTFRECIFF